MFILNILFFSVCFVLGSKNLVDSTFLTLLFKMASAVLFVVNVFTIINVFNIKNDVTKWLSKYYLEIYLFQGMSFILCRNRFWGIEFIITAVAVDLFLAVVFHPMVFRLMNLVKRDACFLNR